MNCSLALRVADIAIAARQNENGHSQPRDFVHQNVRRWRMRNSL